MDPLQQMALEHHESAAYHVGWSDDMAEKSMDGKKEVEAIVKLFGLNPAIMGDAAWTWVRPAEL
jgi:hypothetical protein